MLEKLINRFKEVWGDVIGDQKEEYNNAACEIEGLQNLQDFYDEKNITWNDTWKEFLYEISDFTSLPDEEKEKIESIDIIDYIF